MLRKRPSLSGRMHSVWCFYFKNHNNSTWSIIFGPKVLCFSSRSDKHAEHCRKIQGHSLPNGGSTSKYPSEGHESPVQLRGCPPNLDALLAISAEHRSCILRERPQLCARPGILAFLWQCSSCSGINSVIDFATALALQQKDSRFFTNSCLYISLAKTKGSRTCSYSSYNCRIQTPQKLITLSYYKFDNPKKTSSFLKHARLYYKIQKLLTNVSFTFQILSMRNK